MTQQASANTPAPDLTFVKGTDGRYRASVYTLGPGRIGFAIEVVDIFREGIHAHRTVGGRCLPEAMAWASKDAHARGVADKGQQALLSPLRLIARRAILRLSQQEGEMKAMTPNRVRDVTTAALKIDTSALSKRAWRKIDATVTELENLGVEAADFSTHPRYQAITTADLRRAVNDWKATRSNQK